MSVNRDPKVGDRFTWGDRVVRVVTRVEDDNLYYNTYGDSDSLEYTTTFEEWRADAVLIDLGLWADTDGDVGTVPLSQWDQKAQLPDSETPPEWPGSAFLAQGQLSGVWYAPLSPARAAKDGRTVYEVEPLPGGKVLLHLLRKDGGKW